MPRKAPKPKFAALPPGFENCIDATVDEVAAWRRESVWTTRAKIRSGTYKSYLDGRVRKIVLASVRADRERALKAGAGIVRRSPNPLVHAAQTGKKKVGRPPKAEGMKTSAETVAAE
jgi:hypothetical protein